MINEEIKIELKKNEIECEIRELEFDENLNKIEFKTELGFFELQQSEYDNCDCGSKSHYLVSLDGFSQSFKCKECILENIIDKSFEKLVECIGK